MDLRLAAILAAVFVPHTGAWILYAHITAATKEMELVEA